MNTNRLKSQVASTVLHGVHWDKEPMQSSTMVSPVIRCGRMVWTGIVRSPNVQKHQTAQSAYVNYGDEKTNNGDATNQ